MRTMARSTSKLRGLRPTHRRLRIRPTSNGSTKLAHEYSPSAESPNNDASQQISTNDESIACKAAAIPMDLPSPFETSNSSATSPSLLASYPRDQTDILVAGCLAIDFSCDYLPSGSLTGQISPQHLTSNPAAITQTIGGVGHNVALAIHYLGASVRLCSLVGDDLPGSVAVSQLDKRRMQTTGILKRNGCSTAQYVAVNNSQKDLVLAMADMKIMEYLPPKDRRRRRKISFIQWEAHIDTCQPKWVILDANWDSLGIRRWIGVKPRRKGIKMAFEPVSAVKSKRLFANRRRDLFTGIDLATPNLVELNSMHAAAEEYGWFTHNWQERLNAMGKFKVSLEKGGAPQQAIDLLPLIPTILTKMGDQGVVMTQLLRQGDGRLTSPDSAPYILSRSASNKFGIGGVYMRFFPAVEKVPGNKIISVNGVGDTFLGILVAGLAKGNSKNVEDLIDIAQRGSVMTLKSREPVSPQISTLRSEL